MVPARAHALSLTSLSDDGERQDCGRYESFGSSTASRAWSASSRFAIISSSL